MHARSGLSMNWIVSVSAEASDLEPRAFTEEVSLLVF